MKNGQLFVRALILTLVGLLQVNAQDPFTYGLVAHYPFNGNANDASGNGNNATTVVATLTTNRFGSTNAAYSFDGSSEYIDIPDSPSLDITNAITIAAWMQFQPGGDINPRILHKHVYQIYTVGTGSSRPLAFGCPPTVIQSGGQLTNGIWYFVTGTYDRSMMRLFVDGSLVAASLASHPIDLNDLAVRIGRNSGTGSDFFKGILDDVRIYNRALSDSEVQALYSFENGLVAYYPFNGNGNDASGNGNNATTVVATPTSDRFGSASAAYSFDGSSEYIDIPDSPTLDITNAITLTAWMQFQPGGEINPRILHKHVYQIYTVGTGSSRPLAFGCPPTVIQSGGQLTNGIWYFVAGTYDRSMMRLFVDGSLVAASPASHPIDLNDLAVRIGRNSGTGSDFFKGILDDVRIYNRALSDSELQRLYAFEAGRPYISIAKAVRLDHEFLKAGTNYQLQVSHDLNTWTNLESPFTATSSSRSEYRDVTDYSTFFRLVIP